MGYYGLGEMEGANLCLGLRLFLGCPKILSSHKDLSKFSIVIDVVVLGVVVLGMKVGDEVVWDVVVRKKILKYIGVGGRVLWLGLIGGVNSWIGVNISLGVANICFEVIRI